MDVKKGEDSENGGDSKGVHGNNESSPGAAAEEVTDANSKKPGSGEPGSKSSSSAESTTSASGVTRSFEEFEIGAINETNGQIEIQRSKELGELPSSTAQTSGQTANSNTQNADENAQKSSSMNQEPFEGSGSADYGKDVPFGL